MIGEPETEAGMNAMFECFGYFGAALEDRKANPRDDMLTAMTEAEVDGEKLSLEEQIGMILLLFFAGIETTVFHMTNICYELGAHPELQQKLRDDPALIPSAMEEILRYDAPVQGDIRTLRHDVELHGEQMREGDIVLVLMGSANRDPSVFPDPDVLDVTRAPNPHLTFAAGCPLLPRRAPRPPRAPRRVRAPARTGAALRPARRRRPPPPPPRPLHARHGVRPRRLRVGRTAPHQRSGGGHAGHVGRFDLVESRS